MNKISIFSLKALRKLYSKLFRITTKYPDCESNPKKATQLILEALNDDKPCMIARFGSNELLCVATYLGVKENNRNIISYISGKSEAWWWNKINLENMYNVAGFFPPSINKIEQFCELMLQDIPEINILGSWIKQENIFNHELRNTKKIHLMLLEPFWDDNPWTKALEGKKVLVVHPFVNEIEQQYKNKDLLFKSSILPDFELKTVKAVMSFANEKTEFEDWFDALNYMKAEIDKHEYDICLIGAGAYGLSLAAHVKRKGKKAIHLGGSLQLLFGIRGKRWEDPTYGTKEWGIPYGSYPAIMNEYWIRPGENAKPAGSEIVEGNCYW